MIYNNNLNGGKETSILFTWYLIAKSNQYISVGTQGISVFCFLFLFLIFFINVIYRIVASFGFFLRRVGEVIILGNSSFHTYRRRYCWGFCHSTFFKSHLYSFTLGDLIYLCLILPSQLHADDSQMFISTRAFSQQNVHICISTIFTTSSSHISSFIFYLYLIIHLIISIIFSFQIWL